MDMGYKILRHPPRRELVAYAEALVDRKTAISAAIGAHVAACPDCAAEVKAIRESFEFTASLPDLEPSENLTKRILEDARVKRDAIQREKVAQSPLVLLIRGAAYAATAAAVAGLSFSAFMAQPTADRNRKSPTTQSRMEPIAAAATQEALRKAADQVVALSATVRYAAETPQGPREREHRRTAAATAADLAAARAALERNPGNLRATDLLHAALQQQAQTLRQLYLERGR